MIQGQQPPKAATVAVPAAAAHAVKVKYRGQRHFVKVRNVTWMTPTTYLIYFVMDDNGSGDVFDFQAGQFMTIFVEKDGKKINRPYSIASAPHEKAAIEICIKVVEGGFMSNYLKDRKPGDRYQIMAPLGGFILQEPIETDVAFISTGTGVAPFVAMAKTIFKNGNTDHDLYMFTGVRYVKELLYHDLFREWERKYPNFHYVPSISRPETPAWSGRKGYVQVAVKEEVKTPEETTAYSCGLHEMVEETRALCAEMRFASVRAEKWD